MTTKKDRSDWIQAAFARIAAQGIDSVRIEPLAKDMRVTKGSFYWHFANRDELLKATLDEWHTSATSAVIAQAETVGPNPQLRIEHLWGLAIDRFEGRLEMAIRNWATTDSSVQIAIEQVDGERISYLRSLLREAGLKPATAEARAYLLYSALLGHYLLPESHGRFTRKRVLDEVKKLLVEQVSTA